MDQLQEIYTIKNPTEPKDYLRAMYIGSPRAKWYITAKHLLKKQFHKLRKE
jgi:hypothetical protein